MGRDKSRDDRFFDCGADHETSYIIGLYTEKEKVRAFIEQACKDGVIKYLTHQEVYELIQKKLGYPIPF